MDAVGATGAALVLEDGRIAWPEGRAGAHAVRTPLRWKRRVIGELVADRDAPFTEEERALLEAIAHHAAVALEHGRAVMRGVLAQEIHHRVKNNLQTVASLLRLQARAEGVDPREALEHGRAVMRGVLAQEIHHRVKNNLQTVASLLRLQARSAGEVDPRRALDESVNRILAIAAVHEVLTERRDDEVELDALLDRLRAMLVQGLVSGKTVEARLAPVSLAGDRATALALVFSELLQNALEHGGGAVTVELAQRNGDVVLAVSDDGAGLDGDQPSGTGLSIVEALVRDELGGTLELRNDGGLRAEVVFPA
jgi:two-component sensor histidine kinase